MDLRPSQHRVTTSHGSCRGGARGSALRERFISFGDSDYKSIYYVVNDIDLHAPRAFMNVGRGPARDFADISYREHAVHAFGYAGYSASQKLAMVSFKSRSSAVLQLGFRYIRVAMMR